jgi:sugar-specific transcriptional regulator TrmB
MNSKDFLNENVDSYKEYNDEASMAKSNLHTIIRAAKELEQVIHENENMAEWAQEKIAIVKSMIVMVKDYVESEHERALEKGVNEDATGMGAGSIASSMGGGDGFGKSIFMSRKGQVKTKKKK